MYFSLLSCTKALNNSSDSTCSVVSNKIELIYVIDVPRVLQYYSRSYQKFSESLTFSVLGFFELLFGL